MRISTKQIALAGLLSAITAVMAAVGVGFIPIPTLAGAATIMHVPVLVAGALAGPLVGGFTGGIFGLFTFIQFGSIVGGNPIILFLPRILIGVLSAYTYKALSNNNRYLAGFITGMVGTLTNTMGVLGLAWAFGYFTMPQVMGIVATNLPLELTAATVVSTLLLPPLHKALDKVGLR